MLAALAEGTSDIAHFQPRRIAGSTLDCFSPLA